MGKQRSLGEPEKALAFQTQGVREGCLEERTHNWPLRKPSQRLVR